MIHEQRENYKRLYQAVCDFTQKAEILYKEYEQNFDNIQQIIANKIFSNMKAWSVLIENHNYNEAKIIIRSIIESVVLFIYYKVHPDCKNILENEADILKFKNVFCEYQLFLNLPTSIKLEVVRERQRINIEEIKEEYYDALKQSFENLKLENQKLLLNQIKKTEFILDDDSIKKLDKYFKNLKLTMLTLHEKLKNLKDAGFSVDNEILKIKNTVYSEYNVFSQIAHGDIGHWENIKEDTVLYLHPIRLLSMFIHYSKDIIPQYVITERLYWRLNAIKQIEEHLLISHH